MTRAHNLAFLPLLSAVALAQTFTGDVAAILQERCQICHRPGEAAPFSLLTYEQARPWAKAIKAAVLMRKMPPWFADPHYGKFSNDCSLPQSEIDTLVGLGGCGRPGGRPEGHAAAARVRGWLGDSQAGRGDRAAHAVRDPGDRRHRISAHPDPGAFQDGQVGAIRGGPAHRPRRTCTTSSRSSASPGPSGSRTPSPAFPSSPKKPKTKTRTDTSELPSDFLVGYAPGQPPERFEPGQAKLIRAGSDIILQVHYTTNGKPGTDRSRIGLVFAKEPPRKAGIYAFGDERQVQNSRPAIRTIAWMPSSSSAPTSRCTACTRTCTGAARISSIASSRRAERPARC